MCFAGVFNKHKLAVLTTVLLLGMSAQGWAAGVLEVPDRGLSLKGETKQEYMRKVMDGYFHPAVKITPKPLAIPEGWQKQELQLQDLMVERFSRQAKSGKAIIYFHGGGYVQKAGNPHRILAMKEAELFGAGEVFMPDYRLAPQYTYPAALEDAAETYKEVLKLGYAPEKIIFVGDSAGGNLAVVLALYLRDNKLPQPGAVIAVSPWATMEHKKGTSRYGNAPKDMVVGDNTPMNPHVIAAKYVGRNSRKLPLLSPVYADFTDVAPLLIQVGGNEIFLTESVKLAEQAAKSNTEVTLSVYSGMPHDFALLFPTMQESINSLKEMQSFVKRYLD